MYPGFHASTHPDKPAVITARTGDVVTYSQLEERSVRLADRLRRAGLQPGDRVALLARNDPRCLEVHWAALRSGLYLTSLNHHFTPEEAAFVLGDCGAGALIVSGSAPPAGLETGPAGEERNNRLALRLLLDGEDGGCGGYESYEQALAASSPVPPDHQPRGGDMLYSSGTTGRPKGIVRPLTGEDVREEPGPLTRLLIALYGFGTDTVYLSPAPLYHAAPLRYCSAVLAAGGTVVLMDRFDAEEALALVERHRVTHSQWVPTMFVRMLKLPQETRKRYDLSSLQVAIHSAAPCPVEVKQRMMDWWGPVLYEYYAATESHGMTAISPGEWLERPGSVGRALVGELRICDEEGGVLPAGATGTVYFTGQDQQFEYHNDPERTAETRHPLHPEWTTTGDIGHVDEDGFLFLTDRHAFTIISGGVNIYPQEIENALALHPLVSDVAVIGLPDEEMGEAVTAIVEPAEGVEPGIRPAEQLLEYLEGRIARYKVPRAVKFTDRLPRTPTGKLAKKPLRELYARGV